MGGGGGGVTRNLNVLRFCLRFFIFEMAEQRDYLSASDGSSNSVVPSVQSVDISERVSALEISLSSIQSNLQRLVGMQTHSVTADNSGINSHVSDVPGPSSSSSVPPFLTVSAGNFSSTSQSQGISTNSAINALDVNFACSSATPSLVLPKDWLSVSFSIVFDSVICTRPHY